MAYLKELKITYRKKRVKDDLLNQPAKNSEQIYELFKWMAYETREIGICVHLSPQLKILSYEMVGMGDATGMTLDIPGIFRGAMLGLAHSIVLIHNHPHGSKKPSKEDLITLDRLKFMGEVHNIKLVDFMVIGEGGYFSLEEDGSKIILNSKS